MKLYLASANNKQDISLFEEYKCLYMLNTFYDLMKMNDEMIERILSIPEEFILDSGAFTFMKTEEYHLLGTEKVKSFIHLFITDYSSRIAILTALNLL